ncbi:unnamed protein product, partial [Pylaiella littoralis]
TTAGTGAREHPPWSSSSTTAPKGNIGKTVPMTAAVYAPFDRHRPFLRRFHRRR